MNKPGLVVIAAIALLALPAQAQRREPSRREAPAAATLSITAIGQAWNEGTLRFGGRSYRVAVHGIAVIDTDAPRVRGTGRVFNLHRLQDFSGAYTASVQQPLVLRNQAGVEIRLETTPDTARLKPTADGIRLAVR